MDAENEYWMSQIERENPALAELLRDFGYSQEDWESLDPAEKEDLTETAISCYCINHGLVSIEEGVEPGTEAPTPKQVEVFSCKLW